jgi:hypothetical protein
MNMQRPGVCQHTPAGLAFICSYQLLPLLIHMLLVTAFFITLAGSTAYSHANWLPCYYITPAGSTAYSHAIGYRVIPSLRRVPLLIHTLLATVLLHHSGGLRRLFIRYWLPCYYITPAGSAAYSYAIGYPRYSSLRRVPLLLHTSASSGV